MNPIRNDRRGEAVIAWGGRAYPLRLTLAALAELESALGAGDLAGLSERFAAGRLAGRDVIALLTAALRGGGACVTPDEVAAWPLEEAGGVPAVLRALAACLAAGFGETGPDPRSPQGPRRARRRPSRGTRPSPSPSVPCGSPPTRSGA